MFNIQFVFPFIKKKNIRIKNNHSTIITSNKLINKTKLNIHHFPSQNKKYTI